MASANFSILHRNQLPGVSFVVGGRTSLVGSGRFEGLESSTSVPKFTPIMDIEPKESNAGRGHAHRSLRTEPATYLGNPWVVRYKHDGIDFRTEFTQKFGEFTGTRPVRIPCRLDHRFVKTQFRRENASRVECAPRLTGNNSLHAQPRPSKTSAHFDRLIHAPRIEPAIEVACAGCRGPGRRVSLQNQFLARPAPLLGHRARIANPHSVRATTQQAINTQRQAVGNRAGSQVRNTTRL